MLDGLLKGNAAMNRAAPCWFLLLVPVLFLVGQRTAQAAQSYENCAGFILSVPAVIATPGTWCLKKDLRTTMASGTAILIDSDNVTLDCNHFNLDGSAAGLGTGAIGIRADDRHNSTVRNCNVEGFEQGVYLIDTGTGSGGGRHIVEDSRFDGNTVVGVHVDGDGSVVRRNRVFDTGGSAIGTNAYGIITTNSVDIIDNIVSGVAATSGSNGTAYGMYLTLNVSGTVSRNRVRGLFKDNTGTSWGIFNGGSARVTIRNNNLVGNASIGSYGIYCPNVYGRAKDNLVGGFAIGLAGCGNAGGNVVTP